MHSKNTKILCTQMCLKRRGLQSAFPRLISFLNHYASIKFCLVQQEIFPNGSSY